MAYAYTCADGFKLTGAEECRLDRIFSRDEIPKMTTVN